MTFHWYQWWALSLSFYPWLITITTKYICCKFTDMDRPDGQLWTSSPMTI